MRVLNGMKIEASKSETLKSLIANREKHVKIVTEARAGYLGKCATLLATQTATLNEAIKRGEPFKLWLTPTEPQDHTKVYDTAIKMLHMHTGETIELTSDQVQTLVMDDWDWKGQFLLSNAAYSGPAAADYNNGR